MKLKSSILIMAIILILLTCSCGKKGMSIDVEESFFSSFDVENEKVYIYCNVLIKNPNRGESEITLVGVFEDDVKNGLLKEANLKGYSTDGTTSTFKVAQGDNWIEVVFVGEFSEKNEKLDRSLPVIQINVL